MICFISCSFSSWKNLTGLLPKLDTLLPLLPSPLLSLGFLGRLGRKRLRDTFLQLTPSVYRVERRATISTIRRTETRFDVFMAGTYPGEWSELQLSICIIYHAMLCASVFSWTMKFGDSIWEFMLENLLTSSYLSLPILKRALLMSDMHARTHARTHTHAGTYYKAQSTMVSDKGSWPYFYCGI